MSMQRLMQLMVLAVGLMVMAACQPVTAQEVDAMPEEDAMPSEMRFDIAEDAGRFVFSEERLFEDGMPQYGTPFVTQGYIYPEGTLNGSNGAMADGSPEFPEEVIGEWTCYGWLIGDGAHTESGRWVVSTQIYRFDEEVGSGIIVTDGFELADLNEPISRAISSGTGVYQDVRGEQVQELLGFTDQMGVNLRVAFHFNQ